MSLADMLSKGLGSKREGNSHDTGMVLVSLGKPKP